MAGSSHAECEPRAVLSTTTTSAVGSKLGKREVRRALTFVVRARELVQQFVTYRKNDPYLVTMCFSYIESPLCLPRSLQPATFSACRYHHYVCRVLNTNILGGETPAAYAGESTSPSVRRSWRSVHAAYILAASRTFRALLLQTSLLLWEKLSFVPRGTVRADKKPPHGQRPTRGTLSLATFAAGLSTHLGLLVAENEGGKVETRCTRNT